MTQIFSIFHFNVSIFFTDSSVLFFIFWSVFLFGLYNIKETHLFFIDKEDSRWLVTIKFLLYVRHFQNCFIRYTRCQKLYFCFFKARLSHNYQLIFKDSRFLNRIKERHTNLLKKHVLKKLEFSGAYLTTTRTYLRKKFLSNVLYISVPTGSNYTL